MRVPVGAPCAGPRGSNAGLASGRNGSLSAGMLVAGGGRGLYGWRGAAAKRPEASPAPSLAESGRSAPGRRQPSRGKRPIAAGVVGCALLVLAFADCWSGMVYNDCFGAHAIAAGPARMHEHGFCIKSIRRRGCFGRGLFHPMLVLVLRPLRQLGDLSQTF